MITMVILNGMDIGKVNAGRAVKIAIGMRS